MNTNYYNDLLSQRANVREQLNRLPSGAWMTKLSLEARLSGLQETINNLVAKQNVYLVVNSLKNVDGTPKGHVLCEFDLI